MVTVNTRILKDRLSSYLHRAEEGERVVVLRDGKPVAALVSLRDLPADDEEGRLAALESRGLLIRPRNGRATGFRAPRVPARGKSASEMVIEDRR
ncbi:MAG TPA: type II toxin-antitoxin system prevent-host-death family antitoxin [Thermoanaerobaculia bacterium]|jgi:prevent-host-death family protein